MTKKEYYTKSLFYISVFYLSARFIYIMGFANVIMAFLAPESIGISNLITACVCGAYLLEYYMIELLSYHEFDLETALDFVENGENDGTDS